jgi:DNA-binding transcriptional MerR regulator
MAVNGILVSELAKRTGTTRKALRLYEAAGLVTPARRTPAGYRVYSADAVPLVGFILKARRAGFTVAEIRDIAGIRRSGRAPCAHVRALIDSKLANIDRAVADLNAARDELAAMRKSWRTLARRDSSVCPHIEGMKFLSGRRRSEESHPVHRMRELPGGRTDADWRQDRRRRQPRGPHAQRMEPAG